MRLYAFLCLVFLVLATGNPCFCQTVAGCYPQCVPPVQPCPVNRPAPAPPISRTVQVDVPVPCPPAPCGPVMLCPSQPCAPPVCAPPCPTLPVQVRVDVVIRPEAPKPCPQPQFKCENPPVFEPFFCQAAGLLQSLIVAPLGIGEKFMGHPLSACPPRLQCAPQAPLCSPRMQPMMPCVSKCQPLIAQCAPMGQPLRYTPSATPVPKTRSCVPAPVQTRAPNSPFPR